MDYFNSDEREKQNQFANRRDKLFRIVTNFLANRGFAPNHITIVSVLFLFLAVSLGKVYYLWVASFLFLYVALDGLDGPLARYTGKSSEGGSIVDMFADQLGVVMVSAAACYHLDVNGASATIFSSLYISSIVFMVFANAIGVKYFPVLRVKYFLYLLYVIELAVGVGVIGLFLLFFALYYFCVSVLLLFKIYSSYYGENGD